MSKHTKIYETFEAFKEASDIMDEFQVLHNILRNDYIVLLDITEEFKNEHIKFNSLYRSCLIRLFTMIEADLFGLATLDPYSKTKSKENFSDSFTNTFNKVSSTWQKLEIKENYFQNHLPELLALKKERNELTHPKKVEQIITPKYSNFQRVQTAFEDYNNFMNQLMNKFYIGMGAPMSNEQIHEIIYRKKERGVTLNKFVIENTIY